jgi:hypothetical protein
MAAMSDGTLSTARRIAVCGVGMALSAACALSSSYDRKGQHPNDYGVDLYEPFDNSRDWGPAYLVGPPSNAEEYPRSDWHRAPETVIRLAPGAGSAPSIPSDPSNGSVP